MTQDSSSLKIKQNVLRICLAILSVLLVALLTLGSAGMVSAQSSTPSDHSDFSDIKEGGNYFRNYLDYMIDKDILRYDTGCVNPGTGQGFCPDEEMPRWQVAVLIARALNNGTDPTDLPSEATFADVAIDDNDIWYAPHVEFIAQEGITAGCGNGDNFCPDAIASRGQMAQMLKNAFNVPETTETGDVFKDVPDTHVYGVAINDVAAVDVAITFGCGYAQAGVTKAENKRDDATDRRSHRFCPAASKRDQLVTLLARAMLYEEGVDTDLDPIDTSAPINTDKAGKELPPTGPTEGLLLGSLFITSLAASIACTKIYYDTRKRQKHLL